MLDRYPDTLCNSSMEEKKLSRAEKMRRKNKALGLVRYEILIRPEWKQAILDFLKQLEKQQ